MKDNLKKGMGHSFKEGKHGGEHRLGKPGNDMQVHYGKQPYKRIADPGRKISGHPGPK